MLAVAALGLIGCADKLNEDLGANGLPKGEGSSVYMNVAIALPTAPNTRSATDDTEWDDDNGQNDQTNSDENENNNPDYEYGYASENNVNNLLIVLASADNKYIAHAAVPITQSPADRVTERFNFTASQKFSREDIDKAYETVLATDKNVNVYAICNYTADLLDKFNKITDEEKAGKWIDWTGEVIENASPAGSGDPTNTNSIWSPNSFLMSNATVKLVGFPEDVKEWDNYTTEEKPFHLSGDGAESNSNPYANPIRVERAAARIDYKEVTKDANGNTIENSTYPLFAKIDEETKANLLSVQLTRMALVNMSKNYHYIRRVSNDGTETDWKVAGAENTTNYVVDTDWADKQKVEGINIGNAGNHFNFTLFNAETGDYNLDGWYTSNISDVLNGTEDTWDGSKNDRYHIWRYVTENTIPQSLVESTPYAQQKTVQSVGVIFKGSILPGAEVDYAIEHENADGTTSVRYISEKVEEALNDAKDHKDLGEGGYPILYSYEGRLFAGLEELVDEAKKAGEASPLYVALKDVFGYWSLDANNNYIYDEEQVDDETKWLTMDEALKITDFEKSLEFKNLITKEKKITIYEASYEDEEQGGQGWGYYCYYFYWNRHNDNGNNSRMGKMEFATVRNNVYKLSVSKIGELGHPRIPANDPDPVDPEDPDEDDNVYMDVKVEVLPWVVRVNDIQF